MLIIALLRVSSDNQETDRQKTAITRYAEQNGLEIDMWLEDKLSRDNAKNRPEFQQMMRLVTSGKVSIVLVDKLDRFGVSGEDEWMHYRWLFIENKTKMISVAEGDMTIKNNPQSSMSGYFAASASGREQNNISHRVLGAKPRFAEKGEWMGGNAPFGYDKVCSNSKDAELWRLIAITSEQYQQIFPEGRIINLDKDDSRPRKSKGEKIKLSPNPKDAEIVKRIFHLWTTQHVSLMGIALRLNKEGLRLHGRPFHGSSIKVILKNRKYLGMSVWGEKLMGRFNEFRDGRVVPLSEEMKEKTKGTKKKYIPRQADPDQVIICPNAHPAIIDQSTFDRAQEKLKEVKDNKQLAPRQDRYWLKDVLYCGDCGKRMTGVIHKEKAWYICPTYAQADQQGLGENCKCGRNNVEVAVVEKIVIDWLRQKQVSLDKMKDITPFAKMMQEDFPEFLLDWDGFHERDWYTYFDDMADDFQLRDGNLTPRQRRMLQLVNKLDDNPCVPHTDPDLQELDSLKTQEATERLDALEEEYKATVLAKGKAKSPKEEAIWQQEQDRLEAAIRKIGWWQTTVGDQLSELKRRMKEWTPLLTEAIKYLNESNNREKGEAVRRVIGKVVLHFRKEPMARADTIHQALAVLGTNARGKDVVRYLAERGFNTTSSVVATVRKRPRQTPRNRSVLDSTQIIPAIEVKSEPPQSSIQGTHGSHASLNGYLLCLLKAENYGEKR